MKKLFAATLALGLLSGCAYDEEREMELQRKEITEQYERAREARNKALAAQSKSEVDNIKNAAENNPIATGIIVVGLLAALDNAVDNVTAVATATATSTSTSTSTSTGTK